MKVDPEAALREATAKFRRRFKAVETLAAERGSTCHSWTSRQLDLLWEEVKAAEPALAKPHPRLQLVSPGCQVHFSPEP